MWGGGGGVMMRELLSMKLGGGGGVEYIYFFLFSRECYHKSIITFNNLFQYVVPEIIPLFPPLLTTNSIKYRSCDYL